MRRIIAAVLTTALGAAFLVAPVEPAFAATPSADAVMGQSGSMTAANTYTQSWGLKNPNGVVTDASRHRMFVADSGNNRVLVFNLNTDNTLPDDTADAVLGQSNFTSSGNGAAANKLNGPVGLALDEPLGRLYVADRGVSRVLVFDVTSVNTGQAAIVVLGQATMTDGLSGQTQAGLRNPNGVALGLNNRYLFVADDQNLRVMVFDTAGLQTGMNATYVLGQSSFTARVAGSGAAQMDRALGVAVDNTNNRLYVADYNNNRVTVFDLNNLASSMSASLVIGKADLAGTSSANQSFFHPSGVTVGGGKVYVADTDKHRVLAYASTFSANDPAPVALYGQPDYASTTATSPSATTMKWPGSVYIDPSTFKLYVADTDYHRVLIFNTVSSGVTVTGTVAPIFTFTVAGRATTCNGQSATGFQPGSSASVVSLGSLSSTAVNSAAQDLSVTSNAAGGFTVLVRTTNASPVFRDSASHSVADVAGTVASPGAAPVAGTEGFGFTSSDVASTFTTNTWAKLTSTNGTAIIGAANMTSKSACIGYAAAIANTTIAGTYSVPVIYTAVPTF